MKVGRRNTLAHAAALTALLAACGSDGTTSGTVAPVDAGPPDPDAPRICFEMAERVASAAALKCAQDKQANYDAFVSQAKCDAVTNIRNIIELRRFCFETDLPALTCGQLAAGRLPASCAAQLIRPR